jgi:ParB-like chromosome segregation protein Spo0J
MRNQGAGWPSNGTTHITVAWLPIASLKLDPRNPRVHSARQIRQVAQSIKTFGFNVPILIDGNGNVLAGHGRILASKLLGRTAVPTICLDHLTEAQARAFMIADNRLSENSVWDESLLAEQLKELSLLDLDFRTRRHRLRYGRDRSANPRARDRFR